MRWKRYQLLSLWQKVDVILRSEVLQKVKWVKSSTAGCTKQEIKKEEIPHTICINGAKSLQIIAESQCLRAGALHLGYGIFCLQISTSTARIFAWPARRTCLVSLAQEGKLFHQQSRLISPWYLVFADHFAWCLMACHATEKKRTKQLMLNPEAGWKSLSGQAKAFMNPAKAKRKHWQFVSVEEHEYPAHLFALCSMCSPSTIPTHNHA